MRATPCGVHYETTLEFGKEKTDVNIEREDQHHS